MIPNGFFDTFQPRIDFSYGLDVEIRPKSTPGAGTQVQYSTALRLHGHDIASHCFLDFWILRVFAATELGAHAGH